MTDQTVVIALTGRIDSKNAPEVEKGLLAQLEGNEGKAVVMDADDLEYISSAGLRALLHIRKKYSDLTIINVQPQVYEILDMTGFTQMMKVEKQYRVISIEGCEEIGRGGNGTVYRIDQDNVVKVYSNANALDDIQHEREVAKLALILGIPTAISYDVVRVGDSYGSVFELLNASSFSKILAEEPEKLDWCVSEYVKLLKKIHSTEVPEGKLPDMRGTAVSWAEFVSRHIPEEAGAKLLEMMKAIPYTDHMIHGDYHTKNVEMQDGEVLLIDMDTLAVGHPVFELASMYNAYIGNSEYDPQQIMRFQGFSLDIGKEFWHKTLAAYLETDDEARLKEVEDKARVIGYTRLIRRAIRRREVETQKGLEQCELWKKNLLGLLETVDTLVF